MLTNWDKAVLEAEIAISIAPVPENIYRYARILDQVGRSSDAIVMCKKGMITDPITPAYARGILVLSYYMSERYEDARDEGIRMLEYIEKFEPDYNIYYPHMLMAAIYAMSGQMEISHKHANEVLKANPHFSLDRYEKVLIYKHKKYKDRLISALRQAGLN